MKFCDKVARTRRANNLSQEQLADQLNVTRQSVSKWESGDSYPDMAKIIQICKVLNCTIDDILDDEVISQTKNKEEIKTGEEKVNVLKKYLEDFLNLITNSVNMLFGMSFKSRLTMVIEMAIVILLVSFAVEGFHYLVDSLIWNLLNLFKIAKYAYEFVSTLIYCAEGVLALIVVVHIFKIRYLDYYITVKDKNATEKTIEEPIKENQTEKFSKEKVVVIRDPEHSSSKFVDGLVNVFSFLIKIVVIIAAIPLVICFVALVGAAVFSIFNKGKVYLGVIVACVGSAILSAFLLLVFYNIIFNRKQNHKVLISMMIIGLLVSGIGVGIFTNRISKIDKVEKTLTYETTSEIMNFKEIKDNDIFYISSPNIEFVIDEAKEDIDIEFVYPKNTKIVYSQHDYEDDGTEYYFYVDGDVNFKQLFDDLAENRLRDSYAYYDMLHVKVTCNSTNKNKVWNNW